jgi:Tol biopolymer transport system component
MALALLALTGCRLVPEQVRLADGNRIAYVGEDGQIYSVLPDGQGRRLVSGGEERVYAAPAAAAPRRAYNWPTWAPDDGHLAFIARDDGKSGDAVVVAPAAGGAMVKAFAETEQEPFFASWSTDSRRLAVLARAGTVVTLAVAGADGKASARQLTQSSSAYFAWLGAGALFVHTGGSASDNVGATLARYDLSSGGPPSHLSSRPAEFRVPALSPDGKWLATTELGAGGESTLFVTTQTGADPRRVAAVRAGLAALWAPRGGRLAYALTERSGESIFASLQLWSEGARPVKLASDPLAAFFWSPDGERLAIVGFDPGVRSFSWWVVEVAGGPPRRLAQFTPSRDELFVLTFFDQFAPAMTPWSPDSRRLVYVDASRAGDTAGRLTIVDTADGRTRQLATGSLATWSWH